MNIPKLCLASIVFTALFVSPSQIFTSGGRNDKALVETGSINIAAVETDIRSAGWNKQNLSLYRNYILNYDFDTDEEIIRVNSFNGSAERNLLNSLIAKRQGKQKEVFDSLYVSFRSHPPYFIYYEELVSAAQAAGQLSVLKMNLNNWKDYPPYEAGIAAGLIAMAEGEYSTARRLFAETVGTDSLEIDALYHLSYAERYLGNYEEAQKYLHTAGKLGDGDQWFMTKLMLAEGGLYFLSGDYINSARNYNDAVNLSSKTGDINSTAKAYMNLGMISDINGDISEAREFFNKALKLGISIDDVDLQALAYSELGVSYTYTNELVESKQNYLKGYALYKKTGNNLRLALLSNNLGRVYMGISDYHSAMKCYEEGLKYSGEDVRGQVLNITGLGDVHANLSNYTKALRYYKEAKMLSDKIEDLTLSSDVNRSLGALNINLNRPNQALEYYKKAFNESDAAGDIYTAADISHKMGITMMLLDSLDSAEELLLKAVEYASSAGDAYTEASAQADLALLYNERNNIPAARMALVEAVKIASKYEFHYLSSEQHMIEGMIAESENNNTAAGRHYIEAIKSGGAFNHYNLRIESLHLAANLLVKQGLLQEADKRYSEAVTIIDDVSKPLFGDEDVQINYFSGKSDIFNDYAELCLSTGRYEEAFSLIDRSRSRNMLQNLNILKLQAIVKDEELLSRLYDYDFMLMSGVYTESVIDSLHEEYSVLKRRIINKYPESEKYLHYQRYSELKEVQSLLKKDEYLLFLHTGADSSYIFVISENDFFMFKPDVSNERVIEHIKEISPYYGNTDEGERNFFNQDLFAFNTKSAYRLYKVLLEQALKNIPSQSSLIFSLPSELAAVPMEFLVTDHSSEESAYNYSSKKYLIHDYNISYIPSASVFVEQRKNRYSNNGKVLIVGDPFINSDIKGFAERRSLLEDKGGIPRNIALMPLRYSDEEVSNIGNMISADKVLQAREATETNFKANAEYSKVIHLSTHSFLYNKQPVIFFSNFYDPENDGFLEAGEIVKMRLNSDLVVLSSCNSGLGVIDDSEGILGMSKALFEAGTKSVVVSLWEVNDKYTSKFMELFYKRLSSGDSKTAALRNAKIKFMDNYSANPYYWSAFVLTGNTGSLDLREKAAVQPVLIIIILAGTAIAAFIFFKRRKR